MKRQKNWNFRWNQLFPVDKTREARVKVHDVTSYILFFVNRNSKVKKRLKFISSTNNVL